MDGWEEDDGTNPLENPVSRYAILAATSPLSEEHDKSSQKKKKNDDFVDSYDNEDFIENMINVTILNGSAQLNDSCDNGIIISEPIYGEYNISMAKVAIESVRTINNSIYLSNNNGSSWFLVTYNEYGMFNTTGHILKYKIVLNEIDGNLSVISDFHIYYCYENISEYYGYDAAWKGDAPIESDHDYSDDTDKTWTIVRPDALFIRVTFERIQLGSGDTLTTDGGVWDSSDGDINNVESDWYEGDAFTIRLQSDSDGNTGYGFKIANWWDIEAIYIMKNGYSTNTNYDSTYTEDNDEVYTTWKQTFESTSKVRVKFYRLQLQAGDTLTLSSGNGLETQVFTSADNTNLPFKSNWMHGLTLEISLYTGANGANSVDDLEDGNFHGFLIQDVYWESFLGNYRHQQQVLQYYDYYRNDLGYSDDNIFLMMQNDLYIDNWGGAGNEILNSLLEHDDQIWHIMYQDDKDDLGDNNRADGNEMSWPVWFKMKSSASGTNKHTAAMRIDDDNNPIDMRLSDCNVDNFRRIFTGGYDDNYWYNGNRLPDLDRKEVMFTDSNDVVSVFLIDHGSPDGLCWEDYTHYREDYYPRYLDEDINYLSGNGGGNDIKIYDKMVLTISSCYTGVMWDDLEHEDDIDDVILIGSSSADKKSSCTEWLSAFCWNYLNALKSDDANKQTIDEVFNYASSKDSDANSELIELDCSGWNSFSNKNVIY